VKIPSRIHQIKCEEQVNKNAVREVVHEREVHSAMQMSQSWDELSLVSVSSQQQIYLNSPISVLNITILLIWLIAVFGQQ